MGNRNLAAADVVPHSSRQNEAIEMVVPRAPRRKWLPLEFGSLGITSCGCSCGIDCDERYSFRHC